MSDQLSSNAQSPSGSPTPAPAAPAAAAATTNQQPTQQSTQRPAYVLESEWDATAGKVTDKFGERVNGLVARDAEAQVRRNSLPKEADFQVKLPPDFQLPEGVAFEFDAADPALAQARKIAAARGIDQETFSEMLGVFAANKIGEAQKQTQLRETNMAQLGAAGPQRIEAVATWLQARAGEDGKTVANFIKQWPSAPIVKAMETLIRQFSSQGGADFSQSHRETQQAEAGKIPGYENMSFTQRRVAQMQQAGRLNSGGAGR